MSSDALAIRKVLVILEPADSGLGVANLQVLGAVTALRQHLTLECDLVLCDSSIAQQQAALLVAQVKQVLYPEAMPDSLAETRAPWLAKLADAYDYILIASSSFGKNLLPRLAALLDTQPISDVIAFDSATRFKRPVYAGSAIASVTTEQTKKLLTIRTSAFPAAATGSSIVTSSIATASITTSTAQLVSIAGPATQHLSRVISEEKAVLERPELASARVVVSGGRGLQSKDNFGLVYRLADKLGAAVGASRAAVDAGFVANDMQVGQTGKVVAPELYIAVGISGAVQHLAGMSESRVVVAINNDPDAPIFQVADYGLVGDLFDVLPELIERL